MTRRVDITVDEIVLFGLEVGDPVVLADAVGDRLTRLVAERGLPDARRLAESANVPARTRREPGPVTVRVDGGLAAALAEAIWTGIGERR